jgi:hypothetical protein
MRDWLVARTIPVVVHIGKGTIDWNPPTVSSGTLVTTDSRHFVMTCAHILAPAMLAQSRGTKVAFRIPIKPGTSGAIDHKAVFGRFLYEFGPRGGLGRDDIALIELKSETVAELSITREFLDLDCAVPAHARKPKKLVYRAFPQDAGNAGNIGTFENGESVLCVIPYVNWTNVLSIQDDCLVLEEPQHDDSCPLKLGGISGSAVFDYQQRLRGMIWGGNPGIEIFATSSSRLIELIGDLIRSQTTA